MRRALTTTFAIALILVALAAHVGAAEGGQININTASAAELATIKGIGPAKAQSIIDYREQNGSFKAVDDLKLVRGIGDKMLDQLRPQVTVGDAAGGGSNEAPQDKKR
jgi:competence protein ComEA